MTFYSNGVFTVSTADELNQAIADVDAIGKTATNETLKPGAYTITITANITLGTSAGGTYRTADGSKPLSVDGATIAASNQLYALNTEASLTINGGGNTLDGAAIYNGFFVYSGTITLQNLTITNAVASGGKGGDGQSAGGGGAGLGGGLFVAQGGAVTLNDVNFTQDAAVGGAGGIASGGGVGGGGGMGGAGGDGNGANGGGGGVGLGASGGYGRSGNYKDYTTPGGYGIVIGGAPGGDPVRAGGIPPTIGGLMGGGGDSNNVGDSGGGGVGGYRGSQAINGKGGFGGGGGSGGGGGFGGGGGGVGGNEYGFGGGAGSANSPSLTGFGGGNVKGYNYNHGYGGGGGGVGAGGDVFVESGGHLTIGSGVLDQGTAIGGAAGGSNASAGAGLGAGIFIQGDQTVTLSPGTGETLTISGDIVDQSGSTLTGTQGSYHGSGHGVLLVSSGTVVLTGANSYTYTTISGGTLDDAPALTGSNSLASSSVTFAGTASAPATLILEADVQPGNGGTFANTLINFGDHDMLDLRGLLYTGMVPVTGIAAVGTLTVTEGSVSESLTLGGSHPSVYFAQSDGSGGTLISDSPTVCFAAGTRLRIARGQETRDIAVEDLSVGDLAVTASGEHRPIRWIGHRSIDCRQHPHPDAARPVRIAAHAIAQNQPARDLLVSPGHAICLDVITEVLIPAGALLNGTTIQKVNADHVTYWHIELDTHDILLAENLPAESYLEMGNRDFFQGNLAATPDTIIAPAIHGNFCRPFHATGPLVDVVRAQLRARAVAAGWTLDTTDPWAGLHLVADGVRIDPVRRDLVARFTVPAGACDVWLMSSASRPCEVDDSRDDRALGVCIGTLTIADGFCPPYAIGLADPLLSTGFYAPEGEQRWTTGRAQLPAELWTRLDGIAADGFFLRVKLACPGVPHWIAPADPPELITALPTPRHLARVANSA